MGLGRWVWEWGGGYGSGEVDMMGGIEDDGGKVRVRVGRWVWRQVQVGLATLSYFEGFFFVLPSTIQI